jgi:hypothetical protein
MASAALGGGATLNLMIRSHGKQKIGDQAPYHRVHALERMDNKNTAGEEEENKNAYASETKRNNDATRSPPAKAHLAPPTPAKAVKAIVPLPGKVRASDRELGPSSSSHHRSSLGKRRPVWSIHHHRNAPDRSRQESTTTRRGITNGAWNALDDEPRYMPKIPRWKVTSASRDSLGRRG